MTRYIMTLEDSVKLIEYAILAGGSGDIVIPKLGAMRIADLFGLFAEKYNATVDIVGLRSGEKIHESLINETQSLRTLVSSSNPDYYHILPSFITKPVRDEEFHYHSGLNTLCREELLGYLSFKGMFSPNGTTGLENIVGAQRFSSPYPYGSVDRALDPRLAYSAQREILQIPSAEWDRYDNPFEQKWTLRDKTRLPPSVQAIFDQLTSESTVKALSEVCGITLYNDPTKHYWGVHKYDHNDYLGIHVDAGIHPVTHTKKQLTFGVYLSTGWQEETGCNLEVWSGDTADLDDAKLQECKASIAPLFNRGIWFLNTDNSWHGNPTKSKSPSATRIFLTLSYLSDEQSQYKNHRTRAFFRPLPTDSAETTEKLHRISLARASEDQYAAVYRSKM